jgi:organic hydroperoxide reductase OsmC/OhrA
MTDNGRDDTIRRATVSWLTDPPHGHARVRVDSGAFAAIPLSVPGGEPRAGETTPGELLAAAYSAFMATNLAQRLEGDGKPADELVVDVRCRLSPEVTARSVEGIDVEVRARVPGLDRKGLRTAAANALAISRKALGLRTAMQTDLRVSLLRTARV